MIVLTQTKRTDPRLLERMASHYSQPKGFVGRSICYAVTYDGTYYGHIIAGSATLHLAGRNEYLGVTKADLNHIVNNIFFNVSPVDGKYPMRNFTSAVLKAFVAKVRQDWEQKYGDVVWGFETLVEKPRTGELYRRAGWQEIGETKGFTCKRVAGKGTDAWSGKRVWDVENLRPKVVLAYNIRSLDNS